MRTDDSFYMRLALGLAKRGYGHTSPNPMVGAVLVKAGKVIGRGWHRRAGEPHAEIEALDDTARRGLDARGATLYVTLEPCSTVGRTPPCTEAIIAAGIRGVVVGTVDPNPRHSGRGIRVLRRAGIKVVSGCVEEPTRKLNEAFNHWIRHRRPWVIVKTAMTIDGKIATASGASKWISGPKARHWSMRLRRGVDAVLVGINTVLADNPSLTVRPMGVGKSPTSTRQPRRIVLDAMARTPLTARIVRDAHRALTTIVVSRQAPARRVAALRRHVRVWMAPTRAGRIDLNWLLRKLGAEEATSLLVEGGGEVNASFFEHRLANRIAFIYAPRVLGGRHARKAVAGDGARGWSQVVRLEDVKWQRLGADLLLTARPRA